MDEHTERPPQTLAPLIMDDPSPVGPPPDGVAEPPGVGDEHPPDLPMPEE